MKALKNVRWEDFDYEYVNDNGAGWLGDGWTVNEKEKKINVDYLDDDQMDFPLPPVRDSVVPVRQTNGADGVHMSSGSNGGPTMNGIPGVETTLAA